MKLYVLSMEGLVGKHSAGQTDFVFWLNVWDAWLATDCHFLDVKERTVGMEGVVDKLKS